MTKSDRYYPDPPMEKDDVRGKAKVLAEEDTDKEDDQVLRQLKRTHASIMVWELLLASEKHRTALTKALSVLKLGRNHSRALFVTAEVGGWKVPCVMIDRVSHQRL
ncbi:hypothetical protein GH714_000135 [Hevea brasiliensis]|uniref:Uncharacterized protein n=1 Tax=Hevea brasiliensis TaxID=3981 RepID=A0A6A6L836_HEVBR|nr:hypothetical protein GH714_000135 [Hevea brasiliensis]